MPLRSDVLVPPVNPLPPLAGLRLHVLGILGRGMGPVARAAAVAGADVTGCDREAASDRDGLDGTAIPVAHGHDARHLDDRHLVVTTLANPGLAEVRRAVAVGRLHHRTELLAAVLRGHFAIGVTGTHGKGTVAAIAGCALHSLERDPLVLLGARAGCLDGLFRAGRGPAVVEADDADGTIARIRVDVSVVTNSWFDHPMLGRTRQEVIADVCRHVAKLPPEGRLVLGRGSNLAEVGRSSVAPVWRLGRDFEVETLSVDDAGRTLRIHGLDGHAFRARVRIHGGRIADNAALAFAALCAAGVSPDEAAASLCSLDVLERRMQWIGQEHDVRVFDDLGKHPAAMAASLEAARELRPRRLHVLYEPCMHADVLRWGRRWCEVLAGADSSIVLPVNARSVLPTHRYAPRDWPHRLGFAADLAESRQEAIDQAVRRCRPGDIVLVCGVHDDLAEVANAILERLAD